MSNQIRNRLLALGCVLIFLGGGAVLYRSNWLIQKPFAIILFIADSLTPSTLTASRLYEGGADHRLSLESLPHLALLSTHAEDYAVPDDASAATALATGKKVSRCALAMNANKVPLPSLVDIARMRGRGVGLISNSFLVAAGLGAFYAKAAFALDSASIAAQLVEKPKADVILGGGAADFLPLHSNGRRKDGRDLLLEMRQKGYEIIRNRSELENAFPWRTSKVFGVFALEEMAFPDDVQSRATQPTLAEMVLQAIRLLQYNRKGYLLVVDASLMLGAAQRNEGERMLRCVGELDKAVATALQYVGNRALIVVTSKQSIGGLRLNGYPLKRDKGISLVGTNTQGIPSLTWSTGPGKMESPVAWPAPAALGIAEDVLALSTGPGSKKLTGMQDNTAVFKLLESNL